MQKPKKPEQAKILDDIIRSERYDTFNIGAFKVEEIDTRLLVEDCPQFNGGDLVEVVRRAKLQQILKVADTRSRPAQVTQADLSRAIERLRNEGTS